MAGSAPVQSAGYYLGGFFMLEINATLVSHNNLNNENPIEKWYGMRLGALAQPNRGVCDG